MRRLARGLIRLYPAKWRERYGEEFAALLEDSSPGWSGVFDLLKGAVKMQFHARSFAKLAGGLAVAGMLAGLAISFLVTPRYLSMAEMRMTPGPDGAATFHPGERLMSIEEEVLSRTSLSRVIQDPRLDLYRNERAHIPLEDVIEGMRTRDIRIHIDTAGRRQDQVAFSISFVYSDPIKAQQTVQALLTGFEDANITGQRALAQVGRTHAQDEADRLEARIAALEKKVGMPPAPPEPIRLAVRTGTNLDVLDPPSLPIKPVYPNRSAFMLTGFGGGLALAIVIAIFRRPMRAIPIPAQTA